MSVTAFESIGSTGGAIGNAVVPATSSSYRPARRRSGYPRSQLWSGWLRNSSSGIHDRASGADDEVHFAIVLAPVEQLARAGGGGIMSDFTQHSE
jgi:hypothetical protein